MVTDLLKKFFGTKNDREIKKLKKIVEKINNLEIEMGKLTNKQLKEKNLRLKERLHKGESLNQLMIEAFATVREASKRILGMRHYDVQLIGGIVLFEGKITEMKTGEGKTLVATCPIYLNALSGRGVHVITVNDYLATRDREIMKPLFDFLGISTGVILSESSSEQRREAYLCDVTYGTASQFGFDYLRDNMVKNLKDKVQRGFNVCIIDEIDSVLIDEARTPLIISRSGYSDNVLYNKFYTIASLLERSFITEKLVNIGNLNDRKVELEKIPSELKKDYEVNERDKNIVLTEKGIRKVQKLLGVKNLYSPENIELTHYLKQALNAKELYKKDKDYLVKDNEIIIIDSFTGRAMAGRRFSDGLHQALEVKEGVTVIGESENIASITIQSYFKMYKKLSGMTGTGETEASEFLHTYNLKIIVIPTNKAIQRIDHDDVVFKTHQEKIDAIVRKIEKIHSKGQPILIGTTSIKNSEELSKILQSKNIKHSVLNAKYHAEEARIIAQAGRFGAVTIATNIAGRGTDILLGGNSEELTLEICKTKDDENYNKILEEMKIKCNEEKEKVRKVGGLFILGTERHESRRIDNQLRGRAGRQGDVGETQFFLSFDDEIISFFGKGSTKLLLEKLNIKYGESIKHPGITKAIENIQKSIEDKNFLIRKNLLEYDEVINIQRKAIYETRDNLLAKESIRENIDIILYENIERIVKKVFVGDKETWQIEEIAKYLKKYNYELNNLEEYKFKNIEEYVEILYKKLKYYYEEKMNKLGNNSIEKILLLNLIDNYWREHLKCLDALKKGIHLRSYAQKNPIIEYKIAAGEFYEKMIINLKEEIILILMNGEFQNNLEEKEKTNKDPIIEIQKCSCGSNKEYKLCCGRVINTEKLEGNYIFNSD